MFGRGGGIAFALGKSEIVGSGGHLRRACEGRRIGQRVGVANADDLIGGNIFRLPDVAGFGDLVVAEPLVGLGVEKGVEHFAHAGIGGGEYAGMVGDLLGNGVLAGDADKWCVVGSGDALGDADADAQSCERACALGVDDGG